MSIDPSFLSPFFLAPISTDPDYRLTVGGDGSDRVDSSGYSSASEAPLGARRRVNSAEPESSHSEYFREVSAWRGGNG